MNRLAQDRRHARSRSPAIIDKNYKREHRAQRQLATSTFIYLVLFNALSALAWMYFAYRCLVVCFADRQLTTPFEASIDILCYTQTMAVLEIVHSAIHIVPSPVATTIMQIFSRLFVVWFIGYYLRAGHHWGYSMLAMAWTISDFTRYVYYLTNLIGQSPKFLIWLRYSLFLVLYPMGTVGEMALIRNGSLVLAEIGSSLRFVLLALLTIYPFGFTVMYVHMLKQRSKHLTISK